ncbi:MAG: HDOD domain-containing protein [Gammaproteobacteria bacterium]
MTHALLARQPIFDRKLRVFAYELLYRPGDEENSGSGKVEFDGDHATSTVIMNTFSDIGIDKVLGNNIAFINFTYDLLVKGLHETLPKEKIVIEILEDLQMDEKLYESVKQLANQGFTIALDDFVLREELRPLVELADIIKIDVLGKSFEAIAQEVKQLKGYKLSLLAEKIEDHAMLNYCKELGFEYFQGYFLSKPIIIRGKKIGTNQMVTLRLLSELQREDIEITDIEKILSQDGGLIYKLLKLINAAAYGLPRKIESLREAVVRLGLNNIRNWSTLIALSTIENKPKELIVLGMTRAKMCEILASQLKANNVNSYFTLGLFSVLDAMLDLEMPTLLEELPLTLEMNKALLQFEGPMGELLKNIIAYEQGQWSAVDFSKINDETYQAAYVSGAGWANDTCGALK